MITTRFGGIVQVIGYDKDEEGNRWVRCHVTDEETKKTEYDTEYALHELRATGGASELCDTIKEVTGKEVE